LILSMAHDLMLERTANREWGIYSTDFTCFIRLIVSLEYLSIIFSYSRRIDNLIRSEEEKQ